MKRRDLLKVFFSLYVFIGLFYMNDFRFIVAKALPPICNRIIEEKTCFTAFFTEETERGTQREIDCSDRRKGEKEIYCNIMCRKITLWYYSV